MYICPDCGGIYSIEDWNRETLGCCTTREMKRNFYPFESKDVIHVKKNTHYVCPNCKKSFKRARILKNS